MLDQAIKYANLGWPIFPVKGKSPAIKGWQDEATSNSEKLAELFKVPHTGIGIATGRLSGITVVDIDVKNGNNGFHTLEMLNIELTFTISAETPTGGRHYYFQYCHDVNSMTGVFGSESGIDIKNDGGLVVLPASRLPNNIKPYQWIEGMAPGEVTIAPFPEDLLKLIKQHKKKNSSHNFELPDKITNGQRNDTLFSFARSLCASGKQENEVMSDVTRVNQERCIEPLDSQEVSVIVKNACNYDKPTIHMNSKGKIKKTLLSVVGCFHSDMKLSGLFYYNLFDGNIRYARTPVWNHEIKQEKRLDDEDLVFIKHYLAMHHGLEVMIYLIQEAIIVIAHENTRHPVRDYLNALEWDGKERLRTWLTVSIGVEDNAYTNCVGVKTLLAAVARAYVPGIKFDNMLILEGPQGLGKSTLVKILSGDWYTTVSLTETDKDTIDSMLGAWIIENEEMVCFTRQDIERVKAFLSRATDRIRLSYDRRSRDFARQSIFIGTINPSGDKDYLKDSTGNRRFWPVICNKVLDRKWLNENRDQLFAEAVVRFKSGEKLWIDDEHKINQLIKNEQEERKSRDPWTSIINSYVANRRVVRASEILYGCLELESNRVTKAEQTRVGLVMSDLGWEGKYNVKSKCREYWDPAKRIGIKTFEGNPEISNATKVFEWLMKNDYLKMVNDNEAVLTNGLQDMQKALLLEFQRESLFIMEAIESHNTYSP